MYKNNLGVYYHDAGKVGCSISVVAQWSLKLFDLLGQLVFVSEGK
jgi:hypothetical protein